MAHFRHEWKHQITPEDCMMLRQRLSAVAEPDAHATDGHYLIRSLYFDNIYDKALREKVNGVNMREKFRIRYYDRNTSFIKLEKKSKIGGLGTKASATLSADEAQRIVDGDIDWMASDDRPLVFELYTKMECQLMKPKVIVDYEREPYTFRAGNIRVTIDFDIRTGLWYTDFLDVDCCTIPVPGDPIILEVKWDEFLPSVIRDVVQLEGRRVQAFSKFEACRMYD